MSWPDNSSPYPGQGEDDRKGDIIPLSVFLDAVNLDLDSRGEDGTAESSPRYDGITLIVSVYYEMQVRCHLPFVRIQVGTNNLFAGNRWVDVDLYLYSTDA